MRLKKRQIPIRAPKPTAQTRRVGKNTGGPSRPDLQGENVPRIRTLSALAGAALLGMTFVLGCSTSPTAPVVGAIQDAPGPISPPVFVVASVTASAEEPPGSSVQTVNQRVDGAAGGVVVAGRFRVTVPAGAFDGPATITVFVPDASELACSLEIDPPSANLFRLPVVLEADYAGARVARASDLALARWEPAPGAWRVVDGSRVDPRSLKVRAGLEHFSRYSVVETRAGW